MGLTTLVIGAVRYCKCVQLALRLLCSANVDANVDAVLHCLHDSHADSGSLPCGISEGSKVLLGRRYCASPPSVLVLLASKNLQTDKR